VSFEGRDWGLAEKTSGEPDVFFARRGVSARFGVHGPMIFRWTREYFRAIFDWFA